MRRERPLYGLSLFSHPKNPVSGNKEIGGPGRARMCCLVVYRAAAHMANPLTPSWEPFASGPRAKRFAGKRDAASARKRWGKGRLRKTAKLSQLSGRMMR
ncbi:MAG: hypothetical protein AMXMBFR74_02420 [Parvibaculum sp.]